MRRKGLATTPANAAAAPAGNPRTQWLRCCVRTNGERMASVLPDRIGPADGRPRRSRAAAVASIVRSSSSPPPSRVLLVRTADRGPVSAGVGAVARHRRRHCQGQMGSNVEEEVARFPVASLPTWQPIMYSRSRLSIRVKIFKLTSWLISVSLLWQRRGCGRRGKYI